MDIASAYRLADAAPAHYVMGVRMEPYSAGHERLMAALENDFLTNPASCDWDDFILGIFVCSANWRQSKKNLASPLRRAALWFWGRRARRLNPAEQILAFRNYLEANREDCWGGYELGESQCNPSPAPGLHSMRVFLAVEMGISEEAFWDRPLLLNRADYWTILEIKGAIKPESAAMREAFAAMKE